MDLVYRLSVNRIVISLIIPFLLLQLQFSITSFQHLYIRSYNHSTPINYTGLGHLILSKLTVKLSRQLANLSDLTLDASITRLVVAREHSRGASHVNYAVWSGQSNISCPTRGSPA